MNRDFARRVLQVLERYGILQPKARKDWGEHVEHDVESYLANRSIILLANLLNDWVPEERRVIYDYEFYESLYDLDHMVKEFAQATGGEWEPEHLRATRVQENDWNLLMDFSFKGQAFHWEFERSTEIWECDLAIHEFARQHLQGNFVDAVGVPDQCQYYYYLPDGAIIEIRALLQELRRAWPTADELINFSRQKEEERDNWACSMAALFQQSDLVHVNEMSTQGERPLHVAVQEVLRRNLDKGMPATLICDFDARPDLVDAVGKTAFDYAQGNERLITWLRNSFTGRWIPGEVQEAIEEHEWYLPIGYCQQWFSIGYLE